MKKGTPPIDIEKKAEEIIEQAEEEMIPCSPPETKVTRKNRALAFSVDGKWNSGDWNFYIQPPKNSTQDERRTLIEQAIHKESERRSLLDEERKRIQEEYKKKGYSVDSRPPSRMLTEEEREAIADLQKHEMERKKNKYKP